MTKEIFELINQEYNFPFEPRKYQVQAVSQLLSWPRAGLFADVGLGKTLMSLWIALGHSLVNDVEQILVIVPPSLIIQWERVCQSITFKDGSPIPVAIYYGTPAQRKKVDLDQAVVITSHQIFRIDWKVFQQKLCHSRMMVIFDEMHNGCRNVRNKIFKRLNQFLLKSRARFLGLTATPISSPIDAYAVCKLINSNAYKNKAVFERTHVLDVDFFGKPTGWTNLELLTKNLFKHAIKLEAEGLIELPDLSYNVVPYELQPAHMKLYKELVENKLLETDDGGQIDATEAQKMFHALQRFITAPDIMGMKKIQAALGELAYTLYQEDESKLIIFANYQDTNQSLLQYFEGKSIECRGVWGKFSRPLQQKAVDDFINGPVQVLVGHPKSLGEGIDGLQDVCYRAVFAELPIIPREFKQSVGRLYRSGQKKKIRIQVLQAESTIQVPLFNAFLNKSDLIQEVMQGKIDLRNLLQKET